MFIQLRSYSRCTLCACVYKRTQLPVPLRESIFQARLNKGPIFFQTFRCNAKWLRVVCTPDISPKKCSHLQSDRTQMCGWDSPSIRGGLAQMGGSHLKLLLQALHTGHIPTSGNQSVYWLSVLHGNAAIPEHCHAEICQKQLFLQ